VDAIRSMTVKPSQLKAARLLLGWTRGHVAKQISVVEKTIRNAETQGRPSALMLERLRTLYEAAGVEFTNGDTPFVRMRESNDK
jgi:DNA-binding XRE family transcriptional regulator